MIYPSALIGAWLLTTLVEGLIYLGYLCLKEKSLTVFQSARFCMYSALINGVTNPLVNYGVLVLGLPIFPSEVAVVLAEVPLIACLFPAPSRKSLIISIIANGASYGTGVLVISFLVGSGLY